MSRPGPGGEGASAVMSVLQLRGVSKTYGQESAKVHALSGVDLSVQAGEMVAVMGPSGSWCRRSAACPAAPPRRTR